MINSTLHSIRNINIAIVEDDDTIRDGIKMLLDGSSGVACVAGFRNGEDAINELPAIKPHVVLMDINLPGINGVECIRTLKDAHPDMLFIMLTVFEDTEAIFTSLSAGASGYLLKSTPPAKLIESIQEVHNGGSPMSGEIARKVVDSFKAPTTIKDDVYGLTNREEEVLSNLAKGYPYKQIADMMHISIDTVRSHIRKIYEKLHVKSRTEAVLKYLNS